MRIDKPKATIKRQTQTTTPVTSDATLVDDTVALVDSTTALVGGATVTNSDMVLNMKTIKPRGSIRRHH